MNHTYHQLTKSYFNFFLILILLNKANEEVLLQKKSLINDMLSYHFYITMIQECTCYLA
jgi:hypothetical protein